MSRPYSEQFLLDLAKHEYSDNLGVELAKLCVTSNLPASYVAEALEVSRYALHLWFRGGEIRAKNKKRVRKMIDIIRVGIREDKLPALSRAAAKSFIKWELTNKC